MGVAELWLAYGFVFRVPAQIAANVPNALLAGLIVYLVARSERVIGRSLVSAATLTTLATAVTMASLGNPRGMGALGARGVGIALLVLASAGEGAARGGPRRRLADELAACPTNGGQLGSLWAPHPPTARLGPERSHDPVVVRDSGPAAAADFYHERQVATRIGVSTVEIRIRPLAA